MNKYMLVSFMMLSACHGLDMGDNDPTDLNTNNKVENKVGPKGELISPANCPNWTASPVTTYDNAKQGNFGCATVTNLGLMLENPRDLEQGASRGRVRPDTARSSDAIKNYRGALSSPAAASSSNTIETIGSSGGQ